MNAAVEPINLIEASFRKASFSWAKPYMEKGWTASLHKYLDADGTELFRRLRLKDKKNDEKVIRPYHFLGGKWIVGEPKFPLGSKPLYGLAHLARVPDAVVYIVEGEAKCEALWRLNVLSTTSGGATSASAADWSPLINRRVVIWPDNDQPGFGYRDAIVAKLNSLACSIEAIDPKAVGLQESQDVVDWLAANPSATADDIDRLPRLSLADIEIRNIREIRSAPEQLHRKVSPPEPYPIDSLGEILAPACASLQRVIQAPDAICGGSLLAAASLAAQGLADVENDGRIHPLSLWMLSVAESGERKSGVDKEAMRAAREYERTLATGYALEREHYDAELEEWKARSEKLKGEAKKTGGAGLAESLRELGPAPLEPLRPSLIVADFTAEGLAKLLAAGRPSLGAFTDEAALVFGGHGMTKESVARTAATLCKLWDCGELDRIRAGDGPMKLWGRRLALHLLAQPVIAERALSDVVLSGQGFLPRCLLSWPAGTAGTRIYKSERLVDDAALIRYAGRISQLLQKALPLAQGQRNELQPRTLRLSNEAFDVWRTAHDAIEGEIGSGGKYAMAKPWASKTPEQCLRIAGVLALLEDPSADVITDTVIRRAADLALWHLNEATRLVGCAEIADDIRNAQAILDWCHQTGRVLLYSSDALRLGPNAIRDNDVFREAVAALERTGWAAKLPGETEVDGRRRRHVWRIAERDGGH